MSDVKPDIVSVAHLTKRFPVSRSPFARTILQRAKSVHAVEDVSFRVRGGETLALIGESGSGKSTIARCVAGILTPTSGKIAVLGHDLNEPRSRSETLSVRRNLQMIFQDPNASLNPRWRARDIIAEPIVTHGLIRKKGQRRERVDELLIAVGLSGQDGSKFPHEFSGGQRQRISIARALSIEPALIIADEPTSALDVSVQAQILNLISDLQARFGITVLFISHNLAVVAHMAGRVAVMYLGRIVENGATDAILSRPLHPYTKLLLSAITAIDGVDSERTVLRGEIPSPIDPPPGCAFHPRCPFAIHRCATELPLSREIGGVEVACHEAEHMLHSDSG